MKVLLTGGAGFIGGRLAHSLVSAGHGVLALDCLLRQVHADPEASAAAFPGDLVRGDVADGDAWDALPDVDHLVHLAAETGTGQSMYEADRYHRVNVEGTRKATAWAAARGIPVIVMSSRAVYGEGAYVCRCHGTTFGPPPCADAQPRASRESDPHRPVSVYGQTKSLAEQVAGELLADGSLTIVRPQNVIGPGQALHNPYTGVLAAFVALLKEERPLTIYGDGEQTRDLLHVDDLTAMLHALIDLPAATGAPRIVNAGSGIRTRLLDLARATAAASPLGDPGIVHVEVHRAGDITHACADMSRARELALPQPHWRADAAVADFVRWAWTRPGATSQAWASALDELPARGATS